MSTVLDLNRRLATALGWTNIVDVGNALLGMPPWGIPAARGQAPVPNWAGCWKACGPLLVNHRVGPAVFTEHGVRTVRSDGKGPLEFNGGECVDEAAIRATIVSAVIAKLEAAK